MTHFSNHSKIIYMHPHLSLKTHNTLLIKIKYKVEAIIVSKEDKG